MAAFDQVRITFHQIAGVKQPTALTNETIILSFKRRNAGTGTSCGPDPMRQNPKTKHRMGLAVNNLTAEPPA